MYNYSEESSIIPFFNKDTVNPAFIGANQITIIKEKRLNDDRNQFKQVWYFWNNRNCL